MRLRISAISLLVFALLGAAPVTAADCASASSETSEPTACAGHSDTAKVVIQSAGEADSSRQVASLPSSSERFAASRRTSSNVISAAGNGAEAEAEQGTREEIDIEYIFGPEDFKPVARSGSSCPECSLHGHTQGHEGHQDYAQVGARRQRHAHVSVSGPIQFVVHAPAGVIRGGGSIVKGTAGTAVNISAGAARVPAGAVKGAAGIAASVIETTGDIVSWAITMPFDLIR